MCRRRRAVFPVAGPPCPLAMGTPWPPARRPGVHERPAIEPAVRYRLSHLAGRAEERDRPATVRPLIDRPAATAGLPLAAVDLVLLVSPGLAEQVDVLLVGERRSRGTSPRPASVSTMARYRRRTSCATAHSSSVPAQPGHEEDLVAVDVADAGDELLVHQQRLQLLRSPLTSDLGEGHERQGRIEGIDPEVRQLGQVGSSQVTNISPNVRGSTKRSWPPSA